MKRRYSPLPDREGASRDEDGEKIQKSNEAYHIEIEGGEITKKKRVMSEEGGENMNSVTERSIWEMSDTEIIVNNIIQFTPENKFPFVFYHQIFHQLSGDRSIVQNDLNALREAKSFKLIHFGHLVDKEGKFYQRMLNNRCESIVLVPTEFYLQTVSSYFTNASSSSSSAVNPHDLRQKTQQFITTNTQISVTKSSLTSHPHNFSDEEVEELVGTGFLMHRENIAASSLNDGKSSNSSSSNPYIEEVYWISHPMLGKVIHCIRGVENRILAMLRRKKYKEVYEKELKKIFNQDINFSSSLLSGNKMVSVFSLQFHLLDLVGRNLITKIITPSEKDVIIRLIQ